ncbi:hypothetical protein [Herbaspirillum chlorophenolicum]|jgi:Tfp pilus assembly protein FimV|uniref:hypothetical protein n=1 Tax=Herbaspirillum chlorophenolicum TaxID=211589 RepID=UPI00067BCB36|nr:hypothetical protein [Herbaspirillum chlorophenolicum]
MGLSWMSALKLIPWVDVVQATPGIVRGARDLWSRTRRAKSEAEAHEGTILAPGDTAQLAARIEQLEVEQLEASRLINTLAEQNAQLVAALDAVRRRTRALMACCVLLAVGLAALWLR